MMTRALRALQVCVFFLIRNDPQRPVMSNAAIVAKSYAVLDLLHNVLAESGTCFRV